MGFVVFLAGGVLFGTQEPIVGCYTPADGGWQIRIAAAAAPPQCARDTIGAVTDNPRLHRRPLYPPADKTMIWEEAEFDNIQRCGFRPLVLAYNEPRFLFDFHSAGGLLGHLFAGLTHAGQSAWFHQWAEIDVAYVDGRMEYRLRDARFPGISVSLTAIPLAQAAGLIVDVSVDGADTGAVLTWAYGGASAFFTNYAMTAPEFVFAPEQCRKNRVQWDGRAFMLRRAFDKDDAYMNEVFAAARYLPGWEAVIRGGSSWRGNNGFGAPEHFAASPAVLCQTAEWAGAPDEQTNRVAVQTITLPPGNSRGYIVIGMGRDMDRVLRKPEKAWRAALARNQDIARRIMVRTPDPYLDAAVRMMAFATEGTWGDSAIVHGGWSWRFAYLGWRTWYGPTCYGWTDRIKRSIRNHTSLGLVRSGDDEGALGALLEYPPGVYYNMNEVFLDQTRQYFDYTNDIELMREIFPILEGIAAWENRRLQPGGAYLYESCLNTWISDSHWYIGGQCTQASAYMLRAHTFLADLAQRLGNDPAPYRQRAERIRQAMQETLWMPEAGVFAEYVDTRGNRLLHPEPELPTLYHAAEFGAANPEQVAQMLHWADTHLRHEGTPYGGELVWSSNWFPNRGRSYTHSTYEMAYGEELNFALTNYLAGRADDAYAILRATLCGIFNGPTPGGLSCHAYADGRQRANDEFADSISMWGRTVAEGLFGIVPKRPRGVVELTPQFPADWPEAEIRAPHFGYHWRRETGGVTIVWNSPVATRVRLRQPIPVDTVDAAFIDGRQATATVERGCCGVNWACVDTPTAKRGTIRVRYAAVQKFPAGTPPAEPVADAREPGHGTVWSPPAAGSRDLNRWMLIDLTEAFNAPLTEVLPRVETAAAPPAPPASQVGFGYWKSHLQGYHGARNDTISDAAWRAKVGSDGVAWTTDGIPFKTSKDGPNIGVVTLAGGFPPALEFPVNAQGGTLYLMISGMTFPVQSHVVNLRVVLRYDGGEDDVRDLVNPFEIGDCWSTWCGRYHDTLANGFENIGGRTGPAGSAEAGDLAQPIEVDTEAHLIPFKLRPGARLAAVRLEAVANDVIFGIMGATVLKPPVEKGGVGVKRYGSVIKVRPEKLEEYKRLHAAVWPGVLQMIRACNIRNYSIYYKDGYLFSYFEYTGNDFDADMAKMAADPLTQEWWAVCKPCQQPLDTRAEGEWWAGMEEVFHCD